MYDFLCYLNGVVVEHFVPLFLVCCVAIRWVVLRLLWVGVVLTKSILKAAVAVSSVHLAVAVRA